MSFINFVEMNLQDLHVCNNELNLNSFFFFFFFFFSCFNGLVYKRVAGKKKKVIFIEPSPPHPLAPKFRIKVSLNYKILTFAWTSKAYKFDLNTRKKILVSNSFINFVEMNIQDLHGCNNELKKLINFENFESMTFYV